MLIMNEKHPSNTPYTHIGREKREKNKWFLLFFVEGFLVSDQAITPMAFIIAQLK